MRLDRVQPGDVIKAAIKVRTGIWGEVTEVNDRTVYFQQLCPATTSDEDASLISAEQLSLPGVHTQPGGVV